MTQQQRPEDFTSLVDATAKRTVELLRKDRAQRRGLIDPDLHEKHHQFIDELINTLQRVQDVKWFVLKAAAVAAFLALLGIFGLGVITKMAKWLSAG